tara:strand:- start:19 stop:1080 length:1062 start_codon:yes stop_codon:yes gene_type:complete
MFSASIPVAATMAATLTAAVTTLLLLVRRQWRRTSSLERDEQTPAETNKGTHEGPTTLCTLGDDVLCVVFEGLRNPLDPRFAMDFSSANRGLWAVTQALRQQLKAEYEAAAALCLKVGLQSCKELREATMADWIHKGLSAVELATLGTLGSVLPKLKLLHLYETSGAGGPDGVQRLAEGLGAGSLPAVSMLVINSMHVGDAGASALAGALGRGALPRLKSLVLDDAAIGDAGVVAIAPALLRQPALMHLFLPTNPFGDEGLAALVLPSSTPASALSPPAGVLPKLRWLDLRSTQVSDAGCAVLASALDSGALPALCKLYLAGIPASADAKTAVRRPGLEQWDCALDLHNPLGV